MQPEITLAGHSADGVTVALPADWTSRQVEGTSLELSDPDGRATVSVVVNEVVPNTPSEPVYTPSSYLEAALPFVLERFGVIVITGSLEGRAQPMDVPGAESAARLEVTGVREDQPVTCSVAAAESGPNMAVLVGTDVEPQLWQQILATFRIDPDTLEPT